MSTDDDFKYGYTLSAFSLHSTASGKNRDPLPLSSPVVHADGAIGLILDVLGDLQRQARTDRIGRYIEVMEVERFRQYLLVKVKGGNYGDEFEIVDSTDGTFAGEVSIDDALTWTSRICMFFPADDELQGIMAAEARSGNTHLTAFMNLVVQKLREESLFLRSTRELADEVAWKALFRAQEAHVPQVDFTVKDPAGDGSAFAEDKSVTSVKISLKFEVGGSADKKSLEVITGQRPDKGRQLVQAVGGSTYDDVEIEQATATIVTDGKRRKYRMDHGFSRFTRIIESLQQVPDRTFVQEVLPSVVDTFAAYQVSLPVSSQVYPLP